MELIITMPSLFGEQLYPYGFPLPAKVVHVNGVSVEEIFIKASGRNDTKEEDEICKDYVRYHLLAPCFIISQEDKEKARTLDLTNLIGLCLEYGIDPF